MKNVDFIDFPTVPRDPTAPAAASGTMAAGQPTEGTSGVSLQMRALQERADTLTASAERMEEALGSIENLTDSMDAAAGRSPFLPEAEFSGV